MGTFTGPNIIDDGLIFAIDAGSERSYSGSLSTSPLKSDEKFERQPFVKPLAERSSNQFDSPSNNYVHNALFLVQQELKK